MPHKTPNACPLHGGGLRVETLVGHRLVQAVAAWHTFGSDEPEGPLDVWLIDDRGNATHITTGADWCLIVEASRPHTGYDLGGSGRIGVVAIGRETPFAEHIGGRILAVREEHDPATGRTALELSFPSGRVRCASWAGDLRLTSVR